MHQSISQSNSNNQSVTIKQSNKQSNKQQNNKPKHTPLPSKTIVKNARARQKTETTLHLTPPLKAR
jgi:hypothetical protein